MNSKVNYKKMNCSECMEGAGLDFGFTMAYQPIFDLDHKKVFAHEALVRGTNGESAYSILSKVNDENRYRFDQACRVKAIELASRLKMDSLLSINFYQTQSITQRHAFVQLSKHQRNTILESTILYSK